MRLRSVLLCLACALFVALPALAQIPTATLRGQVSNESKSLPGVTVTVSSPSLQGTRSTVTTSNGDYILPLLPPGDYTVKFELQGFQAVERNATLAAAQTIPLDVDMKVEKISEEIVVTGTAETISVTPQASTTYQKKMVEQLPVQRDIHDTVLLAPGVNTNGPGGTPATRGIVIDGSQSYENLYMVNGVTVNENIRGQALTVFIEDAIQETTISTSNVSAEYGRFAGGVVNTITKSGGNEVHASGRDSVTNDKWTDTTPLTVARTDKVNNRYEATLGGWFMKDRLWYFGAGRDFKQSLTGSTVKPTLTPFPVVNDEKRYEGKLTLTPYQGHTLTGSYIKVDTAQNGNFFGNILDLKSLVNRTLPQTLKAFNYDGVFSDKFYVQGIYSQRDFTFVHSGSVFTDLVNGTLMVDRPTGNRWNSPTFCGVCTPEARNNKEGLVKGSYFLSNDAVGSHEMVFGYDTFDDVRKADNHQSGSDFRILTTGTIFSGGQIFPQVLGGAGATSTIIQWNPIFIASRGTAFYTNSLFYNDKWRFNDHWSFNVGARYDKNDGKNSQGQTVANDSRVSPRLAAAFDPRGNGDWVVNAGYSQYVTALANSQGDSTSAAGNPATFQWFYRGPSINPPGSALTPANVAIQQIFNWFNSVGGTNDTADLRAVNIPGGTTIIPGSIASPYTQEIQLGITKRLGTRGLLRVDAVRRDSKDFYALFTNTSTGHVTTQTGTQADLTLLKNSSSSALQRQWTGLLSQFQYRFTDRFTMGGVWTLSELKGNVNGETAGSGPVASTLFQNPEYTQASWTAPKGDLLADQRNLVRLWGQWDFFKNSHHALNLSALETYASGLPYGAVGGVDTRPYVHNPGYILPPTAVTYYYSARDAFRTDNISSTDLSLNYSFNWSGPFNKQYEIFFSPQILNVFDQKGVLNVDATVFDATTPCTTSSFAECAGPFKPFNPFTDKPTEAHNHTETGRNFQKGPNFGKPVAPTDYQLPRTFRFSVGIRF